MSTSYRDQRTPLTCEGCPSSCFLVFMIIEFLSTGFMDSESLYVRIWLIFVKIYMLHVSLLKYDAMRSFSSLSSSSTSVFVGLDDLVRMIFGSLGARLPPCPGSSTSLAQLVEDIASALSCYPALVSGSRAPLSR